MTLWLANQTTSRIAAAIVFFDDSMCGGEGGFYHVRGWWNIDPGITILVDNRNLANVGRFWYFHAHSVSAQTPETRFRYPCPPQQFDRCWLIWTTDGTLRFFDERVVTKPDLIMTFTPSA